MARNKGLVFVVIGLVTGVITALIQPFNGPLTDPIEALLGRLGSAYMEGLLGWLAFLAPGLIFGAALGWFIYVAGGKRDRWRWLLFAMACAGSWYAGIFGALNAGDVLSIDPEEYMLMGPIGGLVGASIVAASAAVLYSFARNFKTAAMIVASGTAAGLALHINIDAPHFLFPIWQTAVAASLGWSLEPS